MEGTFIFDKPVTGKYFLGRKQEVNILSNLLSQGENVVMYEPPKTGKTSLVQQAFFNMKIAMQHFSAVQVSFLTVRSSVELCSLLGDAILRATGTTPDDYSVAVAMYLKGTHFVFDQRAYEESGRILSLNWDMDDDDMRAVFTLPYRVAADRGQTLYVYISEFQNIMLTEDGDAVCRLLDEVFRSRTRDDRQAASYILAGSQVNAMKYIFDHRRWFYHQVERVKIGEIDSKDITDRIVRDLLSSGKVMDRNLMLGMCKVFRNNIWYINFFASLCDSLSKGYMMEPVLEEALSMVIAVNEPRFLSIINDLTTFQVQLLRAVAEGQTRFSSAEVIRRYGLNSSANVRRLKDALCRKEIITFEDDDVPVILDPLFEYWLMHNFFGNA